MWSAVGYVKVAGQWVYLYRAIDQFGQVIDVLVSEKRDLVATRRFFLRALEQGPRPSEVSTDQGPAYPRVVDELLLAACHVMEQYANNRLEADHGRVKSRLRPMRGLKQLGCARVITAGHAFVQNLRRGHYELGVEQTHDREGGGRLHRVDCGNLIPTTRTTSGCHCFTQRNSALPHYQEFVLVKDVCVVVESLLGHGGGSCP